MKLDPHEVPAEWIAESGLVGFKPIRSAFRCDTPHVLIPLARIARPFRASHVTLDENGFGRDRMMKILEGFRDDDPIPPVSVERADSAYRLRAGFHRYYASSALGFSHIPAEIVEY